VRNNRHKDILVASMEREEEQGREMEGRVGRFD